MGYAYVRPSPWTPTDRTTGSTQNDCSRYSPAARISSWRIASASRRISSRSALTSPPDADAEAGPRKRLAPDDPRGPGRARGDCRVLVLEQHPERLDQVEAEVFGESADVVVGLDRVRRAPVAAGLDHVRVEGAPGRGSGSGSRSASCSNTRMNSSPMILRLRSGSSTPASAAREALLGLDVDQVHAELAHRLDHLRHGLVLAHKPVIDEDAGELVADRPVHERRRGCRIDAAGEAAHDPRVPDLRPDPIDLLGDHRSGRPMLGAAGDLTQEAVEDLRPVRRVRPGRMELDPVQASLDVLAGGHRRAGAPGQHLESLRRLEDRVAVAHPALLLRRQPGEQPAAAREGELRPAELARLGRLDPASKLRTIACMP